MSPTWGYLLRLVAWALVLSAALAPLAAAWWRSHAATARDAAQAHCLALGFVAGLAALPPLVALALHAAFAGRGPVVTRAPSASLALPPVEALAESPIAWSLLVLHAAGILAGIAVLVQALLRSRRLRGMPAPRALRNEVEALRSAVGLERHVDVRVAPVASPQVHGVFRARLLLPRTFAEFPGDERRALLLHEFAHVARDDYARNLLLRVLAAMSWFMPAAREGLAAIARVREELCDRWAVSRGASPVALARGLVRLAETGHGRHRGDVAMAADSDLARRVRILVEGRQPCPAARRRAPAVAGVVVVALLAATAVVSVGRGDPVLDDLFHASRFGPVVAIRAQDPGGRFELAVRQGRVLEARVDGRRLDGTHIAQRGEAVHLAAGPDRSLELRVTPYGRIQWDARPPRPGPD